MLARLLLLPAVHAVTRYLPICDCENLRNGLLTSNVGDHACMRPEVHGLQGIKAFCYKTERPYTPYVDSGCPVDMHPCVVSYTTPTFPGCYCDSFANGAKELYNRTDVLGLCQKGALEPGRVCFPRYVGDKKTGGTEYYGCQEDMTTCARCANLEWVFSATGIDFETQNVLPVFGADGTVYALGDQGTAGTAFLYAITPQGQLKWSTALGGGHLDTGSGSAPAIGPDGTVYVGTKKGTGAVSGYFHAINPDGTIKWTFSGATENFDGDAAVINGGTTVVAGNDDFKVYAFSTATGSVAWTYTATSNFNGGVRVAADDTTIYVGNNDGYLYALNGLTGSLKWRYLTSYSIYATPALGADGTVYIGSSTILHAIDPATGTAKWTYPTSPSSIRSSPAVGPDGTIYCGDTNGLTAVTPEGQAKWTYTINDHVDSTVTVGADGTIYFGSDDQNLYALKPNGARKWAYPGVGSLDSGAAFGPDGALYFGVESINGVGSVRKILPGQLQTDCHYW